MRTELDAFVSYASPSFLVTSSDEQWVIINPHIFGEVSGSVSFTVKLLLLELTISVKLLAIKFSPLDWQLALDLDDKERFCYSLGYFREVFDVKMDVSSIVNECQGGVIAALTDTDTSTVMDCAKKGYNPQLPLFEASWLNQADSGQDYVSWRCSDDYQLISDDGFDPSIDESRESEIGFDPSPRPEEIEDNENDDEDGDDMFDPWDIDGTTIE